METKIVTLTSRRQRNFNSLHAGPVGAEIAPEDSKRYVHKIEGLDDMPAHIRTALSQTQLAIPVASGRMALGTWQGIYLFEHRRAPHRREIVLHLLGE